MTMNPPTLQLSLDRNPPHFTPGENVSGRATWRDAAKARSIVVRLYWTTSGYGSEDTEVAAELLVSEPAEQGETRFSLLLPPSPPSFDGQLISLSWGLELLVEPGEYATTADILVSPTGEKIRLPEIPASSREKKKWWKRKGF